MFAAIDSQDPCSTTPCENGATCNQYTNGNGTTYNCSCAPGWTSTHCDLGRSVSKCLLYLRSKLMTFTYGNFWQNTCFSSRYRWMFLIPLSERSYLWRPRSRLQMFLCSRLHRQQLWNRYKSISKLSKSLSFCNLTGNQKEINVPC